MDISTNAHSVVALTYDLTEDVVYWLEETHGQGALYRKVKDQIPENLIQRGKLTIPQN